MRVTLLYTQESTHFCHSTVWQAIQILRLAALAN